LQEDRRIGSFYALKSAGVNESGALLVYNKNGDIIPANQANNDDKQFIGNGLPKFTTGIKQFQIQKLGFEYLPSWGVWLSVI
jgi:hypothetical protein